MTGHREGPAYYQQLFELAPAAYIVTDADLVIQDVNSAAARLLRRPLDHILGKPLVQFIETRERDVFRSMGISAGSARTSVGLAWAMRHNPHRGSATALPRCI